MSDIEQQAAQLAALQAELRRAAAEQVATPPGTPAWWDLQRTIGGLRDHIHAARVELLQSKIVDAEALDDAQQRRTNLDTLHSKLIMVKSETVDHDRLIAEAKAAGAILRKRAYPWWRLRR